MVMKDSRLLPEMELGQLLGKYQVIEDWVNEEDSVYGSL
jgi:hypothetical protein